MHRAGAVRPWEAGHLILAGGERGPAERVCSIGFTLTRSSTSIAGPCGCGALTGTKEPLGRAQRGGFGLMGPGRQDLRHWACAPAGGPV
jgi:hypothetical protein